MRPCQSLQQLCQRLWQCGATSGVLLLSGLLAVSQAQITVDGSLGRPVGALQGPHYVIPSRLGRLRGPNLFHSFGQFNLFAGESATFSGPNSVRHIVSRVTDGDFSVINGLLRSTIPGASLFLLNPAGIVFGPNAQLDLRGSLYASTADYLRFTDGSVFASRPVRPGVLSVAPPSAFGFLGPAAESIVVDGSNLQVPEGHTLALVGGDITVQPDPFAPVLRLPALHTPGGHIHLVSVAAAGEAALHPSDPAMPLQVETFAQLGTVDLQGATIDTSGPRGGTVVIRGGRLMLDTAAVTAETTGQANGLRTGIDVAITDDVTLMNQSLLATTTSGAGRAGAVRLTVGTLTLRGGSLLTSQATGSGPGGAITVTARTSMTISGRDGHGLQSTVGSIVGTTGVGDAGRVLITTPTLTLDDGAILGTTLGTGRAADIQVQADQLTLRHGGLINSSTTGAGAGGNITITADKSLTIAGTSASGTPSTVGSIVGTTGVGDAGRVLITTPTLTLDDGAILGTTLGTGRAADIQVQADQLTLRHGGLINSSTTGAGAGGNITITADKSLTIAGTSASGTPSAIGNRTFSSGNAGAIHLAAPVLTIQGGIVSAPTTGAGRAGDITFEVGRLTLTAGAQVNSSSAGSGAGGQITVTARDTLTVAGRNANDVQSSIGSTADSVGNAGRLTIAATTLLLDDGVLRTTTRGDGRAGDVQIHADQVRVQRGGQIDSGPAGVGTGGNITVTARTSMTISGRDGHGLQSTVGSIVDTTGVGDAGRVLITTPTLTLDDGAILGTTLGTGRAADIQVQADQLTLRHGGLINSSTTGAGAGGNITLTARNTLTITGRDANGVQSAVRSATDGAGHAGLLTVSASVLVLNDGVLRTATQNTGHAGTIQAQADHIMLQHGGLIDSSTTGAGAGGNITLTARRAITLTGSNSDGKESSVQNFTAKTGNAGRVLLSTPVLVLDAGTLIGSTLGSGHAGDIEVQANQITLQHGGLINSSTAGNGAGGNVTLTARDTLTITGRNASDVESAVRSGADGLGDAGRLTISATTLVLDNGTIRTRTIGAGRAGDIQVQAEHLHLRQGARIDSSTRGAGDGGNITLTARTAFTLADRALVNSTTSDTGSAGRLVITTPDLQLDDSLILASTFGVGRAGGAQLQVGKLRLSSGAIIDSSTLGSGPGGDLSITAREMLTITGGAGDAGDVTAIVSGAFSTGNAGRLRVTAPVIRLDGGALAASAFDQGKAGDLHIQAEQLTLANSGVIDSSAFGQGGQAGTITIAATTLTMHNTARIATRTVGDGNAGDIQVTVDRLTMTDLAQIASTSGSLSTDGTLRVGTGQAGTVTLTVADLLSMTGSDRAREVQAGVSTRTFGAGAAGRVRLSAPQLSMTDGAQIGVDTGGDGHGGDLQLQVGRLSLTGGAQLRSGSGFSTRGNTFLGRGSGGTIRVTATDAIDVSGQDSSITASTAGQGRGGDVLLQATERLRLADNAAIVSNAAAQGAAGTVTLTPQPWRWSAR